MESTRRTQRSLDQVLKEAFMPDVKTVLARFMRLLPYLTALNSYRRFRPELFYPYPDIWNGDAAPDGGSRIRLLRTDEAVSGECSAGTAESALADLEHRQARLPVAGHSPRPYLSRLDLNARHIGRREPFL